MTDEEDGLVSARVGKDLFKGGRTGFCWFEGGEDWFQLVSGWEGLVSGSFGSFPFLVTTFTKFG